MLLILKINYLQQASIKIVKKKSLYVFCYETNLKLKEFRKNFYELIAK